MLVTRTLGFVCMTACANSVCFKAQQHVLGHDTEGQPTADRRDHHNRMGSPSLLLRLVLPVHVVPAANGN